MERGPNAPRTAGRAGGAPLLPDLPSPPSFLRRVYVGLPLRRPLRASGPVLGVGVVRFYARPPAGLPPPPPRRSLDLRSPACPPPPPPPPSQPPPPDHKGLREVLYETRRGPALAATLPRPSLGVRGRDATGPERPRDRDAREKGQLLRDEFGVKCLLLWF